MTQREIYKVVERLTKRTYENELDLLKSSVREIVEHSDIVITGGRVWEIDAAEDSYMLRYQYGLIEQIPEDYTVNIAEHPLFGELINRRSVVNYETDIVLRNKGIHLYAATGVGDVVQISGGRYYRYALAFNAPELNATFIDTVNIISSAVTVRLRELQKQKEQKQLQKALDQAWEIQRGLLPDHESVFQDFHIFGISIPDSTVGGDYFDYLKPSAEYEERLGIVISDAASKGLPAAIQALFVSGALRMGIGFQTKISALISRINTLIYETFPNERFVTLCYCELTSSQNGLVLFANAGHCAPIHYRSENKEFRLLMPTGGILGIVPDQKFRVENINMRHGDVLLLYTDGILEAQNAECETFGENRLEAILAKHHDQSAREIAYAIIEEVEQFSSEGSYTDDRTLVVIKREHRFGI